MAELSADIGLDKKQEMPQSTVIAAILLLSLPAWAAEPWKKSYKFWDEKDLHKILNDSPWARPIEVESVRRNKGANMDAPEGPTAVTGAGSENEQDEDEKQGRDMDENENDSEKERMKFIVRWISSRTLREASVRGRILQKGISETEAEKYMPPQPDDYEVAVVGADMVFFLNAASPGSKDKTYLVSSKTKARTFTNQVEIVPGSNGRGINAVVFHFPKTSSSGQASVPAGEKELEFVTREGPIEIRTSFDLRRMIDQQGPDL